MFIQQLPPTVGLIQCPRVKAGSGTTQRSYYAGIGQQAIPWAIHPLGNGLVSFVFFRKEDKGQLVVDRLVFDSASGQQRVGEKLYREVSPQNISFSVVPMTRGEKKHYQNILKTLLAFNRLHQPASLPEESVPASYKKFLDDLDQFSNIVPEEHGSTELIHCMGRWHPANYHSLCGAGY